MPVYMIRAGQTRMVKIGWTKGPVADRCSDLQCGHYEKLHVVRVIEGAQWIERWLHSRFATRRIRREWFRLVAEMLVITPSKRLLAAHAKSAAPLNAKPLVREAPRVAGPPHAPRYFIERLGGRRRTAEVCGITPAAVSRWHRRGIPPRHRRNLVIYAATNAIPGITFDTVQAHDKPPRKRRAA